MNIDSTILQHAGWLGGPEIAVIVIVVILLFGGRKIPELMRGLGKGIKEFKDGIGNDDEKANDQENDKNKEVKE